jgi:hypothetical protein
VRAYAQRTMISRRAFFDQIFAGLCLAVFGRPQDAPAAQLSSQTPTARPQWRNPYQVIEDAASAMKPGDKDSVRAVVDAVGNFPSLYARMPIEMAAVVKQRVIDAQMAYLDFRGLPVGEGAVVDAMNALATAFDAPDYGKVSLRQVQFFRNGTALTMPIFMKSDPTRVPGEFFQPGPSDPADVLGEPMSPLQALFIIGSLIDQKLNNPDYHAAPTEWDRDFYPRLLQEMLARQELQRRIAAGEVQPKYEGRLVSRGPNEFESHVYQRIREMSIADGLKLFNETFARLGIQ